MLRVLHVGLGPLGRMIVADLYRRRLGTVAAIIDPAPDLAGKPLAAIVPEAAVGGGGSSAILPSLDSFSDWRGIDCAIVTTSSDLARCAPTFRALVQRGLPVVSTCEELLYPWLRHEALARELHDLALKNQGRLLGTGVNPGFLMDALPVFATAVCRSVESVHVWRIQDASPRRVPFQKKIGAGLTDQQFAARIKDGSLRHVGLGESLHFISRYLGLGVTRWEESIDAVKAARDLTCALGPIPKGNAAGVRQVAHGYNGGREVITLEFQAAVAQPDPHDRVVIQGDPPLDLTFKGGVHGDTATTAITLNCIPPLISAPPGLHTMATIPLAHFVRTV